MKILKYAFFDYFFLEPIMSPEMPFMFSTMDSSAATMRAMMSGPRHPGFDTLDSLDTNMSTSVFDLTTAVNLTTAATLSSTQNTFALAISEEGVKTFSQIARTFINPSIGLLGFVGNSLGVGVLWRQAKQQKLSIFWYLCGLTVTDILFLLLAVIDVIPRVVQAFDIELAKYLIAHFRLGLAYSDMVTLHSARYIVLVMSCERLISVVKPLHVKDTWLAKYPGSILFTCIFFNMVFLLPIVINSTVVTRHVGNSTEYIFTFKNYDNFMAQYWVIEAIVHSFIPLVFLIAVNIAIPVQFYRASSKLISARRATSKDAMSQQRKITATVLVITVMYMFLSIPLLIEKSLQYINPDFNMNGRYRLVFWFLSDLSKCLAYINAANDFVVFFLVSNNYRAVFHVMYCRYCGGDAPK